MSKSIPSFFLCLMFSLMAITVSIICPTWFVLWIAMELSLLAFMPMFSYGGAEGITLYFLNQVSGSILFMLFNILAQSTTALLSIAMALKLGLFPFLNWVPAVMSTLSWMGCLVMSTLQKVLPFLSLMILSTQFSLIVFCSLISIYYSGVLGVRTVSLRALMAYSSVGNTGWAVLCLSASPSLFFFFLGFYFTILGFLFAQQFKTLGGLNSIFIKTSSFWMSFFVLSGMPPFGVFGMKAVLLIILVKSSLTLSLLLALGAMFPLLYYMTILLVNMSKLNLKELNLSLITFLSVLHLSLYLMLSSNWMEMAV